MGEAKRRKKHDPTWGKRKIDSPPPYAEQIGVLKDGTSVYCQLRESDISGRFICDVSIPGVVSDFAVTVWETRERALEYGIPDIASNISKFSARELKTSSGWMALLERMQDDDDEIIGILQHGKIRSDREELVDAMRDIDATIVREEGKPPMFGV